MADLLIKGLHLPKDWEMVSINIGRDGKVTLSLDLSCEQIAEAVIVPPHGRLIDADVLMREYEKAQKTMEAHGQEYSCSFLSAGLEISTEWYCVEDILDNAPTVIEASEGGEQDG